jgi:tripartite-type tricarboxylate transporter receptor subunit TctC
MFRQQSQFKKWRASRLALVAMFSIVCGAAQLSAHAQQYPDRVVRVINPFPAGGSGDAVIRIVLDKVSASLGQQFIVESRAGASGVIGTGQVAKAAPDGYTLLLGTATTLGTNSATQKDLPYDPVNDFAPIAMIVTTPYFLLVNPSVPAKTLPEFLAYANANRGKLNYGSFGNGSSNHLAFELFRQATGVDGVHVPYKGGAPLMAALLGGEIDASMDVHVTSIQHLRSGKLRALGVASDKRFPLAPDVPTLAEQGHAVEGGTFFALLGPAKMPPQIVATLNREVNKALALPEVKEKLIALGTEPVGGPPELLGSTIAKEVQKWKRLVQARNLKFD